MSDEIEVGEAILAVVGLTDTLKGDFPKLGVGMQEQIVGLQRTIDGLAADFVYDRLPRKLDMPRPFTYRQLLDKFTKPIPLSTMTDIQSKFPEDASDAFLSFQSTLQGAYAHVAEMVPVADYDTYLGPKRIMPTSDKTFTFFNQYWVIDKPLIVFQLMQCGGLNPEQVQAFKLFFPSIYDAIMASILAALLSRSAREASFLNLPPLADFGLATFKQQRVVQYGVNIHQIQPQQQTPPAQPVTPKINPALQTPGQKTQSL